MISVHRSTSLSARSARITIITLCAFPILLACADDSGQQRSGLDAAHAGKLTGSWDITLRLERPLSLRTTAGLPRLVSGNIALLEDRHAERSFAVMKDPTHMGVYDIALDSLDLPPWDRGLVPGVAARVVPSASGSDSLQIVVNPETPGHMLRLSGVFVDDGVQGTWLAESPLGGGGSFTLRRGRGR